MVILIDNTRDLISGRGNELVGFVPTMGNLHAGHISLLEKALSEFKTVYFSIFVNPKQFGPQEDFNRYPRTLTEDLEKIRTASLAFPDSKIIVFAPKDPKEIYPEGENQTVSVTGVSKILEGAIRPGHFDGVTTVVYRLFELVRPTRAYFGLKDYQQWMIIKQMTADLRLPIEIIGMPIIREKSGLALSSRNQYLSPEQKEAGLALYQGLKSVEKTLDGKRENLKLAQNKISELLKDSHWNYLELRDAETLSDEISTSKRLTLLAVYQLGSTRLLDNLQMEIR